MPCSQHRLNSWRALDELYGRLVQVELQTPANGGSHSSFRLGSVTLSPQDGPQRCKKPYSAKGIDRWQSRMKAQAMTTPCASVTERQRLHISWRAVSRPHP